MVHGVRDGIGHVCSASRIFMNPTVEMLSPKSRRVNYVANTNESNSPLYG